MVSLRSLEKPRRRKVWMRFVSTDWFVFVFDTQTLWQTCTQSLAESTTHSTCEKRSFFHYHEWCRGLSVLGCTGKGCFFFPDDVWSWYKGQVALWLLSFSNRLWSVWFYVQDKGFNFTALWLVCSLSSAILHLYGVYGLVSCSLKVFEEMAERNMDRDWTDFLQTV